MSCTNTGVAMYSTKTVCALNIGNIASKMLWERNGFWQLHFEVADSSLSSSAGVDNNLTYRKSFVLHVF